VPLKGMDAKSGYRKKERRKQQPQTAVDSPVRAPATMPGADSTDNRIGPEPMHPTPDTNEKENH
jgi:hypothetical protein